MKRTLSALEPVEGTSSFGLATTIIFKNAEEFL